MNEQFNEYGPFAIGEIVQIRCDPEDTDAVGKRFDGADVEITGGLELRWPCSAKPALYYEVRTQCGQLLVAGPHELRRRKPPATGEQSVMDMFKTPPLRLVEPPPERRISAGWMRDYDRAQALMAAGVKVQSVWPALVRGGV